MKNYFNEVREYYRKQKQKKKEDKELLKKLIKEEEDLEIDIPEANDDFNFKIIVDAVKNDPELDAEIHSYLTESEKEDMLEAKKEERRLVVIMGSIMTAIFLIAGIAMFVLSRQGGGTTEEVLMPKIEEYIKTNYSSAENIISLTQLKIKNDDLDVSNSNMYYALTSNNHHIITFEDKELYADDFNNSDIYEEYKKLITTIGGNYDLIASSPVISHQDFYNNYNLQLPYIKVLPQDKTFNDLLESKKLTVTDTIMYQGTINFKDAKNIINKLSDDSRFIFIKNEKGLPKSISIISKTEYFTLNIMNTTEILEGINYYELDTNRNGISNFNITEIKAGLVVAEEGYTSSKGYKLEYKMDYSTFNGTDKRSEYYFLSMDQSLINTNNLLLFDTTKNLDKSYEEFKSYEYPLFITSKIGGKIYIIGTKELGFANKIKKEEPFLCKIGLC